MRKSTIFLKPYCLRGAWRSGRNRSGCATASWTPCWTGTGIGKTFAYLIAGILHGKCRAAEGKPQRPILISTSSIALQSAIQKEYLPLLSGVLLSEGLISAPIEAVIRKGKAHYACDARLERRVRGGQP